MYSYVKRCNSRAIDVYSMTRARPTVYRNRETFSRAIDPSIVTRGRSRERCIAQRHRRVCRTDIRVHPHRVAGSSGGPRDLWPHREVTQRLIYFTVDRLPLLSSLIFPDAFFLSSSPVRVALTYERPSSRHCAVYMSGQPSLHAATSYLHEKGVALLSAPLQLLHLRTGPLALSRPRKPL